MGRVGGVSEQGGEWAVDREDLWETHADWWINGFTDGADPEYEEQIIPLAVEELTGFGTVLDVGCGDGQISRALARAGCTVSVSAFPGPPGRGRVKNSPSKATRSRASALRTIATYSRVRCSGLSNRTPCQPDRQQLPQVRVGGLVQVGLPA